MMRRLAAYATAATLLTFGPRAAVATFHIIVIDQMFPGSAVAPEAQYVTLRMQAPIQTQVYGQPITAADASGVADTFAAFCSTPRSQCSLPVASPACKAGDCPSGFQANGRDVLV